MACPIYMKDSNATGLAFAEEECLNLLPGVNGADAVWYQEEPNSYSDFGGSLTTVAREPISMSRQNKKGTVTDMDAQAGFATDVTKGNMLRKLQGFFFADVREKFTTAPLNEAQNAIMDVSGSVYEATNDVMVSAGTILLAGGFSSPVNNGLKTVVDATDNTIEVAETLEAETPPSTAMLVAVGHAFDSDEASISLSAGVPTLNLASTDARILGLTAGEWVFLGGDEPNSALSKATGYARVASVTETSITFDDTSFVPQVDNGDGVSLKMFFGVALRNEDVPEKIKKRSYQFERTLGEGMNSTQAEYVTGCVANDLTLNIQTASLMTADLSYLACRNEVRSGNVGDEIKPGTRVRALGEDGLNTSSDVYRIKMSLSDPSNANPSALFGNVQDATLSISNNAQAVKCIGVLGALDVTVGNFVVSGSITAFFSTVDAVRAARQNADVGLNIIVAARNAGFVYDVPLLTAGLSSLNVEKDNPITIPVEPQGAENKHGYTAMYCQFYYLPDAAMSKVA